MGGRGAQAGGGTEKGGGVKHFLAIIKDPKVFNYIIMVLYFLNAARWACARKPADVCYWLSALAITATVTFLYKH